MSRLIVFAWEEALRSLRRTGRSAVLSVATIGVAFLVVGAFLMASAAAQQVVAEWAQAAELSIYLRDDRKIHVSQRPKNEVASGIINVVAELLAQKRSSGAPQE